LRTTGWGRTNRANAKLVSVSDPAVLAQKLAKSNSLTPAIPSGAGRSYGDQALSEKLWSSRRLNHFLGFDEQTGELSVEAGVSLGEIQRLFIPQGWALPVTPGTQYVTVGGAIANDVHGKNHHSFGTFGEHVTSLTLLRTDGTLLHCSPTENANLFHATIGGLGLTGFIVNAVITLKPVRSGFVDSQTHSFTSLEDFWQITDQSESFEYTVSWVQIEKKRIRGLFNRANDHTSEQPEPLRSQSKLSVPFTPPISLFNRPSIKLMSEVYFRMGLGKQESALTHYQPFFYPLDQIANWNRAYGPKGFFQHQALIPKASAHEGLAELISAVQASDQRSMVSVLKTTGKRTAPGLLTYPIEGVTLALDFPNRGASTLDLLKKLDSITIAHGGRVNPSKDATMSAETFKSSFGEKLLNEFNALRDPGLQSQQSIRLLGK